MILIVVLIYLIAFVLVIWIVSKNIARKSIRNQYHNTNTNNSQ